MKRTPIKRGPRRKNPAARRPSRKPTTKRKKAPGKLTQRNQCDTMFSKLIRLRDRVCLEEGCGTGASLQCAHIVSRRYMATRWDFDNAVTLCAAHHMKYTHDPLAWEVWVEAHMGADEYLALKHRAMVPTKPDYEATLADLRGRMLKEGMA